MKTTARVKNNRWDVDDEYLTVEVQVDESEFRAGQRVVVSIESEEVAGQQARDEIAENGVTIEPQMSDEVDVTYKGVTYKVPIKNGTMDTSYGYETM